MNKIRILLADDHPVVRMGIRNLVEKATEMEVVGEAGNGGEALNSTKKLFPDILLLDLEMPIMSGLEVVRFLKDQRIKTRILVLSSHADPFYVQGLFSLGVYSYILKDEAQNFLVKAIQGVARVDHSIRFRLV